MTYDTIDEWIRNENGHQPSHKDQILAAYWFYRNDVTALNDEDRRTAQVEEELEELLDHDVSGVLDNLEDIGVLVKYEPSSSRFIRNERTNEAFFSPNEEGFPPSLYEEMSRLIYDIHLRERRNERGPYPGDLHVPSIAPVADGGRPPATTSDEENCALREFVATELGVPPDSVEEALVALEDTVSQMVQFDPIVEAIKESDELQRGLEYDQVGWRNRANRWALSKRAQRIEVNESLPI